MQTIVLNGKDCRKLCRILILLTITLVALSPLSSRIDLYIILNVLAFAAFLSAIDYWQLHTMLSQEVAVQAWETSIEGCIRLRIILRSPPAEKRMVAEKGLLVLYPPPLLVKFIPLSMGSFVKDSEVKLLVEEVDGRWLADCLLCDLRPYGGFLSLRRDKGVVYLPAVRVKLGGRFFHKPLLIGFLRASQPLVKVPVKEVLIRRRGLNARLLFIDGDRLHATLTVKEFDTKVYKELYVQIKRRINGETIILPEDIVVQARDRGIYEGVWHPHRFSEGYVIVFGLKNARKMVEKLNMPPVKNIVVIGDNSFSFEGGYSEFSSRKISINSTYTLEVILKTHEKEQILEAHEIKIP
mgnify:CR=1 FL=1